MKQFILFYIVTVLIMNGCGKKENNDLKNEANAVQAKTSTPNDKYSSLVTIDFSGEGFLKTPSGEIKTCAGNYVFLEKYNSNPSKINNYLSETVSTGLEIATLEYHILNNNKKFIDSYIDSVATNKEKVRTIREDMLKDKNIYHTICGMDGKFRFKNIPKGKYKIASTIDTKSGNLDAVEMVYLDLDLNEHTDYIIVSDNWKSLR